MKKRKSKDKPKAPEGQTVSQEVQEKPMAKEERRAAGMDLSKIAEEAKRELSKATGLKPSSVTGISKEGNEWIVQVEMVEKESIPDGMDVLGSYEARLNGSGGLVSFSRIRLRKRMDTGVEV